MKLTALFPITITDKLIECKDFYSTHFGFKPVFETDWYIHLVHDSGVQLAVMKPNLENQPTFLRNAYTGEGVVYSFEVNDAQTEFDRLNKSDLKVVLPVTDEEWGQRHFMIEDPAGVHLDIVQQLNQTE